MLKKYDVLQVADEVMTAFGRLGTLFCSDYYGIKPDLITIAKDLTSAYAPLSGVIVADKMRQVLVEGSDHLGSLGHGWTNWAHPICFAAGVPNLELIDEMELETNARETSANFCAELAKTVGAHENVGDVGGDSIRGGSPVRRRRGRTGVLRRLAEDRAAGATAPAAKRRHQPRHAAGRHSWSCPAALPDPRAADLVFEDSVLGQECVCQSLRSITTPQKNRSDHHDNPASN